MVSLHKIVFFLPLFLISLMFVIEPKISIQKSIIFLSQLSFVFLLLVSFIFKRINIPYRVLFPFALFLSWMVLSSFFSTNVEHSLWETLKYFSFLSLFIGTYTFFSINSQHIEKFLKYIVVISSFLVLKDIFLFINEGSLSIGAYFTGSLFWHNQMGGFLLFLIPVAFSFFLYAKSNFQRYIFLLISILGFIALTLTYSRGSWLSLFISFSIFVFFNLKKIKENIKIFIPFILILLIFMLFIIKPSSIIYKIQSIHSDIVPATRTVSGSLRTTVWLNSLEMFTKSPILGIGPGAFGSVYDYFQKDPWLYSKYAHNYYLEILAELGLPGFVFFISILITVIYLLYKNRVKIRKDPLILGVTVALVASFLHSFVDIDFSRVLLYSLFWIFLAIVLASVYKKPLTIEIKNKTQSLYLFPIAFMLVSLLLSLSEREYQRARNQFLNENMPKATNLVKKAIALNPISSKSYLLLGEINEYQNKFKNTKIAYRKALFLSRYNSNIYYRLGIIATSEKEYKEAEKLYKKSIELAPYGNISSYVGLASTYSSLKNKKLQQETIDYAVDKAFPINDAFRGFKFLYDASGFTEDFTKAYIKFTVMELNLKDGEKALKIINILKNLDPQNKDLPFLEENVVK